MVEFSELLEQWQNRRRASADVKRNAQAHVADLDRRIAEMTGMRRSLEAVVGCRHGNDRPDCPLLDVLAEPGLPAPARTRSREKTLHDRRPTQGRGTQVLRSSPP